MKICRNRVRGAQAPLLQPDSVDIVHLRHIGQDHLVSHLPNRKALRWWLPELRPSLTLTREASEPSEVILNKLMVLSAWREPGGQRRARP